ncbi:MAG: universal stress protein [Thermoprotei archaeon]
MFNKILVAYDGSDYAKRALDVAIDLALKYNAKLFIVEVADKDIFIKAGVSPFSNVLNAIVEKAKKDVEEATDIARSKGVNSEGIVLEGDPASMILEYTNTINADLIVTGTRGLSTFKKIFLGSVSSRIINEAKKPVLVVPL